jgi:hypothetical protein
MKMDDFWQILATTAVAGTLTNMALAVRLT